MRPEPPINELTKAVDCDPETGRLTWKRRDPASFIGPENRTRAWNSTYPGKRAFACRNPKGYLGGAYQARPLLAHRVVWALTYGYWPKNIDHINGNPSDNRICNLREATPGENARNCKIHARNDTGVAGVSWNKAQRKYRAFIQSNWVRHYLGIFDRLEDAAAARKEAEQRLGFHPNHGRKGCDEPVSDGPCGCQLPAEMEAAQ